MTYRSSYTYPTIMAYVLYNSLPYILYYNELPLLLLYYCSPTLCYIRTCLLNTLSPI